MDYRHLLEGREAIVTGGAAGVGRAVAMLFASHGASVAILDEDELATEDTLKALRRINPDCCGFTGSLSSSGSIRDMCESAICALGSPDILVNAAGSYRIGDAQTLSEEDFLAMIEKNVKCAVRCTKAIVPHMRANRRGDIISITSDLAASSLPGTAGIAACAGALAAFTRNVTMDYIKYHVRANCIAFPFDGIEGRQPLTGPPNEEDAANAALWYACDMSRFIVGDILPVNGGMSFFGKA
jgi:3-oxoacyl-[acyl-carrier protein] reductase